MGSSAVHGAARFTTVLIGCTLLGCGSSSDGSVPPRGADASLEGGHGSSGGSGDSGGQRADATPGDDGSDRDVTSPPGDGGMPGSDADAGTESGPDADIPSGTTECTSVADCKIVPSYCGSCACVALGDAQSLPHCDAGTVSCLTDPCVGKAAACNGGGHCALQSTSVRPF